MLSTFCLLLVSKLKWKYQFYSCSENKRGLVYTMLLICSGKNFAIREEGKHSHCSFLINLYTCEEGNLISANCKQHKTNAAGWLFLGKKPGCCVVYVIIVSVTTSCLSRKEYKSWLPQLRHWATWSCLQVPVIYKGRCSAIWRILLLAAFTTLKWVPPTIFTSFCLRSALQIHYTAGKYKYTKRKYGKNRTLSSISVRTLKITKSTTKNIFWYVANFHNKMNQIL